MNFVNPLFNYVRKGQKSPYNTKIPEVSEMALHLKRKGRFDDFVGGGLGLGGPTSIMEADTATLVLFK